MKNINKMCSFYVNDWHLTVMILPFINKKINNNEKITIISEENLENNINILLEKLNIKYEIKDKIKNLGWYKTKKEDIEKKSLEKQNIIIIGKSNYIDSVNKIIEEKNRNNITIVDCYEVMDFNNNMENILKKYDRMLNTSGEKEIKDIFEGYSKKEVV